GGAVDRRAAGTRAGRSGTGTPDRPGRCRIGDSRSAGAAAAGADARPGENSECRHQPAADRTAAEPGPELPQGPAESHSVAEREWQPCAVILGLASAGGTSRTVGDLP